MSFDTFNFICYGVTNNLTSCITDTQLVMVASSSTINNLLDQTFLFIIQSFKWFAREDIDVILIVVIPFSTISMASLKGWYVHFLLPFFARVVLALVALCVVVIQVGHFPCLLLVVLAHHFFTCKALLESWLSLTS